MVFLAVFRLLGALENEGMVARDGSSGTYRLGPQVISLGASALSTTDLRSIAHDELMRLAEESGETATLEILTDTDVVVLDEVQGRFLFGATPEIGRSWPAHATSTGKVLLALTHPMPALPRLIRFSARTITTRSELERELARVRHNGFAIAVDELEPGLVAMAAPVHNHLGYVVAALSLNGPGTRLGPYEILAPIGAGGMGEVYKARDTRLDRMVAVKVSNERFSERFEREARAVASLNHSYICTLHDVGPDYLVMEYIEGSPLRGPLPLDQALEFAVQIADALDKAHRHGVVHRDLKPGNIMITRSGVKLLDFGLAKLTGDKGVISPMSQMPTQASANLTADGAILGTLQYMAPEQLEGKDADNRTDIFAFGGVVYEMVTGQKAFNGTSHASLIGAIMTSEPQPMTAIQEMTPASLDHIVLTCLAKDPEDRWQTARDLMRELRRVGTTASPNAPVSVLPMRSRGGNLAKFAIAAIAGALLASGLFFLRGPRQDAGAKQASVTRLTLPLTPIKSLNTYSLSQNFAISPDGRKVVFTDGAGSLWVRDLQEDEATDLRRHQPAVLVAPLVGLSCDVQHDPAGLRVSIARPVSLHRDRVRPVP